MVVLDPVISQQAHDAVAALVKRVPVRAAFVFGSRAWGGADCWSDLDIAAFVEGTEGWDIRQRVQLITSVQAEVNDEVELHLLPARYLERPPRASLAQLVLREGVRIDVSTAIHARG